MLAMLTELWSLPVGLSRVKLLSSDLCNQNNSMYAFIYKTDIGEIKMADIINSEYKILSINFALLTKES